MLQVEFTAGQSTGMSALPGSDQPHPFLSSAPLAPLTFAGEILLQDPLAAAGAVDVALGGEQAQVLAASIVHPAWRQLT